MKTKWIRVKARWIKAKATTRLFWRSLFYGVVSATIAGAVIGFARELDAEGYFDFGQLAFGYALVGLAYGLIAAPVIAFVMKMLADVYYPRLNKPLQFRIGVAGFTLIAVGVTAPFFSVYVSLRLLLSGASRFPLHDGVIILMWVSGVYLSQVLAKQYIAEVGPRKRKEKPKSMSAFPQS